MVGRTRAYVQRLVHYCPIPDYPLLCRACRRHWSARFARMAISSRSCLLYRSRCDLIHGAQILLSARNLIGCERRRRARRCRNLARRARIRPSEVDDADDKCGHRDQPNHDKSDSHAATRRWSAGWCRGWCPLRRRRQLGIHHLTKANRLCGNVTSGRSLPSERYRFESLRGSPVNPSVRDGDAPSSQDAQPRGRPIRPGGIRRGDARSSRRAAAHRHDLRPHRKC